MPIPVNGQGDVYPERKDLETMRREVQWLTEELRERGFIEKPPGGYAPDGHIVRDSVSDAVRFYWGRKARYIRSNRKKHKKRRRYRAVRLYSTWSFQGHCLDALSQPQFRENSGDDRQVASTHRGALPWLKPVKGLSRIG